MTGIAQRGALRARRLRPSRRTPGVPRYSPGLAALRQAEFFIDAGLSGRSGGYIQNLGTGGTALDAKLGSAVPSAYFDGTSVVLPGVAGNYLSTPDAAALDITGDIDLIYCGAAGTFAAQQYFINKNGTGTNGGYALGILSSGFLMLRWSDGAAGFTATSAQSLAAAGLVVNRSYWWRATLDVDNGAGGYQVRLYWAADDGTNVVPTSWTEFTTPAAGVGVTSIAANATQLAVGSWHSGASDNVAGPAYRAIVRSGIGGTTVFDANFALPFDTSSFTASTGQTVTLNRSTSGIDTNDPTLLGHAGVNYLYLPGVAGNGAQVPDSAALDITGDIEIICRVALDDWTPASQMKLVSKAGTVNQRSYALSVTPAGLLVWSLYPDGITGVFPQSTVGVPFTDGQTGWVRATWSDTGDVANFYTAPDQDSIPTVWTQLGSANVAAVSAGLFVGTSNLNIGSLGDGGSSENLTGKFYRAIVRNGIGGTTVADIDFTRGITSGGQTTFTEFSSNAATVTINRATSGRKAVAVVRPVLLLGTDDYLEVADNALLNMGAAQDFSVIAVARLWNANALNQFLLSKSPNAGLGASSGWMLAVTATNGFARFQLSDAVANANPIDASAVHGGALRLVGGTRVAAGTDAVSLYRAGTVSASASVDVGNTTNVLPFRIGSVSDAVTATDMEFVAAAVFRRALSAAEIASIVAHYQAA